MGIWGNRLLYIFLRSAPLVSLFSLSTHVLGLGCLWFVGFITRSLPLVRTALGTARADHVRIGFDAVGNQGTEDTTIDVRLEQLTHGRGHDSGNRRFVQRKGHQARKATHRRRDGPGKPIVVQLQKFHGGINTNAVDGTGKLVVVEIQLGQRTQTQQFGTQRARQRVKVQVQKDEIGENANFGGNRTSQSTTFHPPNSQIGQETHFGRDRTHQIVRF
jgi:hypothetical protein